MKASYSYPHRRAVVTWTRHDFTVDEYILVYVMAWCHQATSHYLNHCWRIFLYHYVGANEIIYTQTAELTDFTLSRSLHSIQLNCHLFPENKDILVDVDHTSIRRDSVGSISHRRRYGVFVTRVIVLHRHCQKLVLLTIFRNSMEVCDAVVHSIFGRSLPILMWSIERILNQSAPNVDRSSISIEIPLVGRAPGRLATPTSLLCFAFHAVKQSVLHAPGSSKWHNNNAQTVASLPWHVLNNIIFKIGMNNYKKRYKQLNCRKRFHRYCLQRPTRLHRNRRCHTQDFTG